MITKEEDKIPWVGLIIVGLMLIFIFFSLLILGYNIGIDEERKKAIEAGAGYYTIDEDSVRYNKKFMYRNLGAKP